MPTGRLLAAGRWRRTRPAVLAGVITFLLAYAVMAPLFGISLVLFLLIDAAVQGIRRVRRSSATSAQPNMTARPRSSTNLPTPAFALRDYPAGVSSLVPEMIPVPGGSIELRDARTKTSRTAELKGFSIAAYPVTWELYSRILGRQPPSDEDTDVPAHSISWLSAVSWCNALSLKAGLTPAYDIGETRILWDVSSAGYRLPTEAEWEWACRAGSTGPHYGPLAEIAWTEADAVTSAQPVGRKQANAFGLFDMLGNVWEWCWDYSDPARYADYRVLRGGGWADKHWSVRASVRRGSMPGAQLDDVGFRLTRGVVGKSDEQAGQGWSRQADRQRAQLTDPVPLGWTPLRT